MRNNKLYWILMLLAIGLAACKKDPEIPTGKVFNEIVLPTVTTCQATDITQTTAKVAGNVTKDGGASVTERGVCWSTSSTPTVSGSHSNSGTGTGSYTVSITGLTANTKYYVRAYAINSKGTGYGEEMSFTTTSIPNYAISVSANLSNGGSVNGGGTYQQGNSCTVIATANDGYAFANWTENGNEVSTNSNYTFTVNRSRSLVANFTVQAPNTYTINASPNPTEGGTVTGGGSYTNGQSCTLIATAATGYTFLRWTENGNEVSINTSYTFTVTGNRTLVAQFQIQSCTISVSANPSSGGTVSGGGGYNYGQSCTLNATAASSYAFTNWTEGGTVVSTSANYTFTVTGNRTLVANFEAMPPDAYSINVSANPSAGGTVSGGGIYEQGQQCTVSATANEGYTFVNWTENGQQVSTNASYTFTVTGNRTLVANFEALPPDAYSISVSANPSAGGTVTGGGTYEQGEQCTVTATAATGYTFTNWTEGGTVVSTNANYTFTVTGNRTLVAQFQVQSYTISASANPSSGGGVSGDGTYNYGQNCTLIATAASGYTFSNWTENGQQVSANANYTFTVTCNRTLVAQFQESNCFISVSANPITGGTVTGGGWYNHGALCTLMATPIPGCTFVCWTENGTQVSSNTSYTFTVTGNRTLVAHFTYNGGGSSHDYVDLGLPSGTLWATCNVGANLPEEYGYYFAWAETSQNSTYTWNTYQYCSGFYNMLTKYCNDANCGYNGYTDNLTVLQAGDDAATANWGSGWRMPTQAEWQELLDNTTKTWTTQGGVNGRLFIASNGNSLFLPAAGNCEVHLSNVGSGYYWSSSLNTSNPNYAWFLNFNLGNCTMYGSSERYVGQSVRPVREN